MRYPGLLLLSLCWSMAAGAAETTVEIHAINAQGAGPVLGTLTLREASSGIELAPRLHGLAPGAHGFHVHEQPSCAAGEKEGKTVAGLAAGSHYDPDKTGKHLGPAGPGHKGDLPVLTVAADGTAATPVQSGRLSLAELRGRSLIIHAEADNYADQPGGARVACGIIQ